VHSGEDVVGGKKGNTLGRPIVVAHHRLIWDERAHTDSRIWTFDPQPFAMALGAASRANLS
jgi:hypothetical protein